MDNETGASDAPQYKTPLPGDIDWTVVADLGSKYIVTMPLSTWIALPGHERRRDTERHARKPHWEMLKKVTGPTLDHLHEVAAAEFEGRVCKVDGHTRALLWAEGVLPPPKTVMAIVYRCATREALNNLYPAYDTQTAAESTYDRVKGAYRQHQLHMESNRFKGGMIVDALLLAATGSSKLDDTQEFDVYQAVGAFKSELRLLDGLNPPAQIFVTGTIAAALMMLALSRTHAGFFTKLALTGGRTKDELCDPVETTRRYIQSLKSKPRGRWEQAAQEDLCARCIAAALLYEEGDSAEGYWSLEPPNPVELESIVKRVRALKFP